MAPRSKDSRLRLGEPLATEFAAFRKAMGMGNSEIGMVRDAIRAFIRNALTRDDELNSRYEAELEIMLVALRQPLRLVPKDSAKKD